MPADPINLRVAIRRSFARERPAGGEDRPGGSPEPRPTGRQASVTGINIYRLADGVLVEHWDEWDLAGLTQKLS